MSGRSQDTLGVEKTANTNHVLLPPEVWYLILCRLRVPTLLTCLCVSKQWKTFITSPSFKSMHLKQSKLNHSSDDNGDSVLMIPEYSDIAQQTCFSLYSFKMLRKQIEIPSPFNCSCVYNSCDGVLCISSYVVDLQSPVYLWNPSIQRALRLPRSTISRGHFAIHLAFGFVPTTIDYKVVKILQFAPLTCAFMVEVYSLSTKNWMGTGEIYRLGQSKSEFRWTEKAVCVDGVAYWLVDIYPPTGSNEEGSMLMICLDMDNGGFRTIDVPKNLAVQDIIRKKSLSLQVFMGKICLLKFSHDEGRLAYEVWVLRGKDSFENIQAVVMATHADKVEPLGFANSGELFLRWKTAIWEDSKLAICNPQLNQIEESRVELLFPDLVGEYVASLVLLE